MRTEKDFKEVKIRAMNGNEAVKKARRLYREYTPFTVRSLVINKPRGMITDYTVQMVRRADSQMTLIQTEIFKKVKGEWEKRIGKGNVDEFTLKNIIQIADVHGDGLKRVSLIGKKEVHLIPIEDIILAGLKAVDIKKYPVEKSE